MKDYYIVHGMTCAACQSHVEKAVRSVPGVEEVSVSLLTNSMSVEGSASPEKITAAVEKAGYSASLRRKSGAFDSDQAEAGAEEDFLKDTETPRLVRRLKASVVFLLLLMYVTMGHNMLGWPVPPMFRNNEMGLALLQLILSYAVLRINRDFFVSGFRSLRNRAPNMDTLVALGSGISFVWSLFVFNQMSYGLANGMSLQELSAMYHDRLYFEAAAMIPALITVGKTLEAYSKGRTTDALRNLMRMRPKTAVVERDGLEVTVDISEVSPGDVLVIRPGEAIPADGIIISGRTAVDESALTGESVPADRQEGDPVSAATVNTTGYIRVRTQRVGEDTIFAQIIRLVSEAAATKAPIARLADRVSAVFVPAVIAIAAAVMAGWLLAGAGVDKALEHAVTVLVISCPCALGLATPVAIMTGSGMGARHGILFKNAAALEAAGKTVTAAVDKTGTLTEGRPEITDIIPAEGSDENELMSIAYSLERMSEHPLARAIVRRGEILGLQAEQICGFEALAGNGLKGILDGRVVFGGSEAFISSQCKLPRQLAEEAGSLAEKGRTPMFFVLDGRLLGIIAVADILREDSASAVKELQNMGIEVVMLTGDNERTAQAVGRQAGVDRVIAGILPDGKEAAIRELRSRGSVAMIGDGINDAPALTSADIGIAIGAGSDVALDSADIVLMNSSLRDAAAAIRLSRAALRTIKENLFWAFAYNAILIPIAAGLFPAVSIKPVMGAAAMCISSFTVCMNALRLNIFKVYDSSHDRPVRRAAADMNAENLPSDTQRKENKEMKKTIMIDGMMCQNCERHVKNALEALDGVESAAPDKDSNTAEVILSADVDAELIRKAVEDAGYEFKGIAD